MSSLNEYEKDLGMLKLCKRSADAFAAINSLPLPCVLDFGDCFTVDGQVQALS